MTQKLLIRDLTLRDGQQSAFATRMNQSQVDRVLPYYKDANFYAMEVWGGAVPDSVMRFLNENPWDRLEKIHRVVGGVSKLTALSRGRNLYGYAPYPDEIIDGFFRNAVASGLDIMRIFDALNDVDNIESSVTSIRKYGGMADCAVCYTIDPKYDETPSPEKKKRGLFGFLSRKQEPGHSLHAPIFTDEYFLNKAKEMLALGADMITIKDMSGLIPPSRVATLIPLFKEQLKVPVDFHTHCTPGFGLGAVLTAIIHGADIVDTVIWNFAGGPAAPAIELIYIFCKKLGIELDVNMEAVAKINEKLFDIRKELEVYDAVKQFPKPFNPLTDSIPVEIDKQFDLAIEAVERNDETALLDACHAIEAYFNFPKPDERVKEAEIPGGMYTNMVAQLKQVNSLDILPEAMKLIPSVRLDAGLPPLVTPTSQIVGVQAVSSALNLKNGRPKYANPSNQFVSLVKGEYGKTPVPVDPEFRLQIAGTREEVPYDTSTYKRQENPVLEGYGGVLLAKDEKEELLLELFPTVAANYLKGRRQKEWENVQDENHMPEQEGETLLGQAIPNMPENENVQVQRADDTQSPQGYCVMCPMPGNILQIMVKEGDRVEKGDDLLVLEAMKMENDIASEVSGTVHRIFVHQGDTVMEGAPMVEII
ncbi:oxaloacetate decarboxylase, alpha subunit/pyruvate carboxylase subunit B [Porphyromonadaceae bacterium NLAE-zl-C104]|nr:oxaloacetate decarboxylase, alpha subunit/pyruvate carboxylase subunit B [Porphyromonadaceae bacterium NLAE-zl-C104]